MTIDREWLATTGELVAMEADAASSGSSLRWTWKMKNSRPKRAGPSPLHSPRMPERGEGGREEGGREGGREGGGRGGREGEREGGREGGRGGGRE